jgi:N-6 DNA Methylase
MRVCDPAAGTGGFLLAAYERMKSASLDPDEKRFLRDEALRGWEIVDATARLCAMNLLLHGISAPESPSLVTVDDPLRSTPSDHFDMVLTNPPFGRKSSYKVVNALGETEREDMSYLREDFWATTSNKQLNFLQHVRSLLTINGRGGAVWLTLHARHGSDSPGGSLYPASAFDWISTPGRRGDLAELQQSLSPPRTPDSVHSSSTSPAVEHPVRPPLIPQQPPPSPPRHHQPS